MKIALKILTLFVLICTQQSAMRAQGEANIWYFGTNAGLDFNTNPPTPLTNGALSTGEGCAAVADKNGVLVFYTDGITVWNKNHTAMPNGTALLGNPSATQSAIIVPYPGTYNYGTKRFNKYYIVTVDYNGGTSGVRYSEVDMTLNGGLGDVTATKNVHLFGTVTSEKVCVAQHSNNCDFWVIGKPVATNDYYAYLITSSGFNNTPVISSVGPSVSAHWGSLKASPDSKTITATFGNAPAGLYVYDFNNTTGVLTFKFSDNLGTSYSQEYSPDNKLLYQTMLNNPNIYQYDLTVTTNAAFLASRQVVGTTSNGIGYRMAALQIASNGKIYAALHGQTSLGVINNPNVAGTGCNYVDMQQGLGGKTSTLGLPAITTSLIRPVNKVVMNDSCSGQQIQFGLLDTNKIISYSWNFANLQDPATSLGASTIKNPVMQFNTPGNYIVTAITHYPCSIIDTIIDTVPVIHPTANFTATSVCKGEAVVFTDSSSTPVGSIVAWNWNFGDGEPDGNTQNPTHTYTSTGTHTIQLIATTTNGCMDTISKSVVVHSLPEVQFTANNTCDEKPVLMTDQSTIVGSDSIVSWRWDFGDNSPLLYQQQVTGGHLYDSVKTYSIQLLVTSSFGCKDSTTHTVSVRPKPVANFSSEKKCLETPTPFTDSSSTSGGTLNIWKWNFGDGSPDNLTQNPSHQYTTAGNHPVTLITQNTFGCADTITKNVTVYFNPVANFTVNDVCLGDSVLFFDSSYVDISASVAHYLWVFNDGSPTDTSKNPHHYYAAHGSYNVTLLASTNQNCSTAVAKTVKVFDAPITNFSVADVCWNNNTVFVNTSTPPTMGAIGSQEWSFGDGSAVDVATNPQHLYAATGTYAITLITHSSNLSCADTATDSVTVFPLPSAAFTAPEVCLGEAMSLTDFSAVAAPSAIVSWDWNYGDGTAPSTLQSPNHIYAGFGSFNVTLVVTTNNTACKDTISDSVIVHPMPQPAFTTSNVCEGSVAQFTDLSTIPANITNDGILSWTWDFGNSGSTSNNQNPSQQYNIVGVDTVQLKVVSNFGCADSITKPIVINPNPVVDFTVSDTAGCEPHCIVFNDASSIASGSNNTWKWTLGDNTSSTDTTFTHCYYNDNEFSPTQYSITLKVTSDSGCSTVLTRNNYITVYPEPVASFHTEPVTTTIANPVFDIKEHSTGANFWSWNFGDTATSVLQHPGTHTYADTGHYTIRLTVTTNYGCTDTSYKTVVVEPDYILYIPNAFTPNGDGVNDVFIPQGIFINEFEMSIFDRWGNLVYKTDDITEPWDGKMQTGIAQNDVYVYVIRIKDFEFQKHNYRGTVSLIR